MCGRLSFRCMTVIVTIGLIPFFLTREVISAPEDKPSAKASKARTFAFTYSAIVTGLTPGKSARIWLPVPPANEDQDVKTDSKELPGPEQINTEPKYSNQIRYVEAKADDQGMIPLAITYQVQRRGGRRGFHRQPA